MTSDHAEPPSPKASEQFVSEAITPVGQTVNTRLMASGEPGLPGRFAWRGTEYTIAAVLRTWKQSGPCHHGSGERYLRKHWFEVLTTSGHRMTIYFERQARRGSSAKARWWLYTAAAPAKPG
jgi:hypothetical protein